ncbi:MaoC/PaaZ C-terminal domain-containing protein [Ewingella sp. AOP9-I1-14]
MSMQYQLQDAEQWAAFSGDNNPIHFNLAAARQLGLDVLCIHGMRAMLDIKASLGIQAPVVMPQDQSLLFSCRLDKPVFYQQAHLLETEQLSRNGQIQLRSTLRNALSQEGCINAKLVAAPDLTKGPEAEDGQISTLEMLTSSRQLSAMTGQSLNSWNVLDALLFKQLIHSPETMCRVRDVLPELDCTDLMAVFSQMQMVQTHHETHFSPSLLAHDDITVFAEPLSFSILPALMVGKSHSGFILRVAIQAFVDRKALIRSSITLKATTFGAE